MAEPVSERAHYVVAGDTGGRADLWLFQEGRLESPGLVPVIWRGRRGGSGAATRGDGPPSRPWWGFFRAVASVLILLF